LQWATLIGISHKNHDAFTIPQKKHFLPTLDYDSASLQPPIHKTRENFWAKDMGQIVALF
jgi:hypothetical protein